MKVFSGFFIVSLISVTVNCNEPLEAAVKNIFKLLDQVPPKGTPFPRIPGPQPDDEVCIVGAGPSGIHMAQSLKNKGYKKLTIYEKTNRVGGKSYDINYHGVAQPQGTVFLTPSYFDTVVPLAKQYGVGDLMESPAPNFWMTNSSLDPRNKLTGPEFIFGSVQQITKEKSLQKNVALLLDGITRYLQLYKDLFGSFQGALMRRPSSDVLHRISGTFLEFLEREDLLVVAPVVSLTITSFGYGQLDQISAVYGLIWNEPRLMVAAVLQAAGKAKDPFKAYFFKNGFELIWKTIAEVEELDIHFNIDLYSVKRNSGNVILKFWKGSYLKEKVCNFLIWTAPMSTLLRTLSDASHQEYSILGSLKPTIFTANLVNMKNDVRNGPYTKHFGTFTARVDHGVTSEVNLRGMLIPNIQTDKEVQNKYDEENEDEKTAYVVQLGEDYSNEKELNAALIEHYTKGFNASDIEILNTISWSYFPKWNPEEASKGRHWDVFEMQGLKKTWYAGSSVSFESVKDVLEYNNLLLRQMF